MTKLREQAERRKKDTEKRERADGYHHKDDDAGMDRNSRWVLCGIIIVACVIVLSLSMQ
jgi:hypothetical protein